MTDKLVIDCLLTGAAKPYYVVITTVLPHPLHPRHKNDRIVCAALDSVSDRSLSLILPESFRKDGFVCPGEKLLVFADVNSSNNTVDKISCLAAAPFFPEQEKMLSGHQNMQPFVVLDTWFHARRALPNKMERLPILHVARLDKFGRPCDEWLRMSSYQNNLPIIDRLRHGDFFFDGRPFETVVSASPAFGRPYCVDKATKIDATVQRVLPQNWGGQYTGFCLALAVDGDEKQPETAPFWRVVYLHDHRLGSTLKQGDRITGLVMPRTSPVSPFEILSKEKSFDTHTSYPHVFASSIADLKVIGSLGEGPSWKNRIKRLLMRSGLTSRFLHD